MENPEGFKSYIHIQKWLKETHNLDVEYGVVHSTVRYGLKAKLKVPRPSNIKKDKEKEISFKNGFSDKLSPLIEQGKKIRLFSFDESRFGLFTVKRRKITLKGVKPVGKVQTKYQYYWLYGAFDVLSGESFYWEFNKMNKPNCAYFIDELSINYPDTINIILMDNSATHLLDNYPSNIKFINTEPYNPELNPAERVWRDFKDDISWENFETIPMLKEHISNKINSTSNLNIMSLTQYSYIMQAVNALNIN